jgi:hypothetical protein
MSQKLLALYERFENDMGIYVEDELLNGNAGYIYCLLRFLIKVDSENKRALTQIRKLVDVII